jgi:hypothetical protein
MKIQYFILLTILLQNTFCFSQGLGEGKRNGIVISNNITYFNKTSSIISLRLANNNYILQNNYNNELEINYLNFNFGYFVKTKKNNFHYLKLTKLKYKKDEKYTLLSRNNEISYTTDGLTIKNFIFQFRYGYDLVFFKSNSNKFLTAIELSVEPYYNRLVDLPKVTIRYDNYITDIGANFSIMPKFYYSLDENLLFKINPFMSYSIGKVYNRIYNPTLPRKAQTTHINTNGWNPELGLNFGIVYLFSNKEQKENSKDKKQPQKNKKTGVKR